MSDQSKLPVVVYWVTRGPSQGLGIGYLLRGADDVFWCLPNENTAKRQPSLASGFRLDQQRLQEQPDTGADRKLYLYDAEVDASPDGQGTIPFVRVSFPKRGSRP